jgi:plastocyanin
LGAACVLSVGGAASAAAEGTVRGRVVLDLPGTSLADLGPVVVYVERGGPLPVAKSPPAEIHQKGAKFVPPFLAVAAGQRVELPNDDRIFHNVFSYSQPNEFDLGLYPAGASRGVTLRHAGEVRLYCSIHESMNGTIFVAPTPWFTIASPDGSFTLRDVPKGAAKLRTWNQRLPDTERAIEVPANAELVVEVPLVP